MYNNIMLSSLADAYFLENIGPSSSRVSAIVFIKWLTSCHWNSIIVVLACNLLFNVDGSNRYPISHRHTSFEYILIS